MADTSITSTKSTPSSKSAACTPSKQATKWNRNYGPQGVVLLADNGEHFWVAASRIKQHSKFVADVLGMGLTGDLSDAPIPTEAPPSVVGDYLDLVHSAVLDEAARALWQKDYRAVPLDKARPFLALCDRMQSPRIAAAFLSAMLPLTERNLPPWDIFVLASHHNHHALGREALRALKVMDDDVIQRRLAKFDPELLGQLRPSWMIALLRHRFPVDMDGSKGLRNVVRRLDAPDNHNAFNPLAADDAIFRGAGRD